MAESREFLLSLVWVNVNLETKNGWKCIVQFDERRQQRIGVRRENEVAVIFDPCQMTKCNHSY